MPEPAELLIGQDDPRGTIVATTVAGDLFVGVVGAGWADPDQGDVWEVHDGHGNAARFLAGDCCVIDHDRIAELHAHIGLPHSGAMLEPSERVLAHTAITSLLEIWGAARLSFDIEPLPHADLVRQLAEKLA